MPSASYACSSCPVLLLPTNPVRASILWDFPKMFISYKLAYSNAVSFKPSLFPRTFFKSLSTCSQLLNYIYKGTHHKLSSSVHSMSSSRVHNTRPSSAMIITYPCHRWVRRHADMARRIVIGQQKPVRRIRLVNFAAKKNWDKMFSRIDSG